MKKKGFTLIELIVVIAIIGVLAAILVPAMLGYVKKSKITTANTTAKSIYNAFNSSLTDLDSQDVPIKKLDGQWKNIDGSTFAAKEGTKFSGSGATATVSDVKPALMGKVYTYFSDVAKCKDFSVGLIKGACVSCGVMNGSYPGAYPQAMTVDEYNDNGDSYTESADILTYAEAKLNKKSSGSI